MYIQLTKGETALEILPRLSTLCSDERLSWNGHKRISEYMWIPHYVPNEYPNIFGWNTFTKQISEYICCPEIAQIRIQIIFEGHFIRIFEYLYSSLIEGIFKRTHSCFFWIKFYTGDFLVHKLYLDLLFSSKIDRQILKYCSEQIFKYIRIFKNLQTNIWIYWVVQKSTNEYPNIFVLENWHKYEYE